jgi:hypothetical protein
VDTELPLDTNGAAGSTYYDHPVNLPTPCRSSPAAASRPCTWSAGSRRHGERVGRRHRGRSSRPRRWR